MSYKVTTASGMLFHVDKSKGGIYRQMIKQCTWYLMVPGSSTHVPVPGTRYQI